MEGNVSKQKFSLQLYSRLTNANPELVLVFMQAGSGGTKPVSGIKLSIALMKSHRRGLGLEVAAWLANI